MTAYGTATAPTVTATTPASGATGVATTPTISVTYSASMQSGTLALSLSASGQSTITCTLSNYNSTTNVATWTLPSSMAQGVTYTATAGGTGTSGLSMASYQWHFTTLDLMSGLVAFWPLSDGSGVPVGVGPGGTPSSGSANAMTWTSGAGYSGGYVLTETSGTAAWSMPITAETALDVVGAITFGAFIKPAADGSYNLIMNCTDGTHRKFAAFLPPGDVNDVFVSISQASISGTIPISTPWTPNAWNCVLIAYDYNGGSPSIVIWLNGLRVATFTSFPVSPIGPLVSASGMSLDLGYDGSFATTGAINFPVIWNRAISDTEAADFYANQIGAAPTVTGTTPASVATGLATTPTITVAYSAGMQSGTLTLSLSATGQPTITGTLSNYNSGTFTATFTPASAMAPGVVYTATANGTGANSTPMTSAYTWTFTTAAATAPTVTATTPAAAATQVSVSGSISVTYSAGMQTGTLSLSLSASGQPTIACTLAGYNASTFTATWNLPSALAHGAVYTATADGTAASGLAMASAYQWSFTTVYLAPVVASVSPTNGSIGVAIGSTITATFIGAVNSASISFTFTPSIAGTTSFADGVATFTPSSSLPNLTRYLVSLAAGAPDGTAMPAYPWSFTTQASPPTVAGTTPAPGATGIGPFIAISATFNEAIDPNTLNLTLAPSARVSSPIWNPGTLTATWIPLGVGLAYATSYSAEAADGTTMTAPYRWTFATHDAPPSGQGELSSTGFKLTGAVDVTSMSVTVTSNGQSISGTAAYDSVYNLITFSTAAPMTPGTKYLVAISGLKTPGGQAMATINYTHIPGARRPMAGTAA